MKTLVIRRSTGKVEMYSDGDIFVDERIFLKESHDVDTKLFEENDVFVSDSKIALKPKVSKVIDLKGILENLEKDVKKAADLNVLKKALTDAIQATM